MGQQRLFAGHPHGPPARLRVVGEVNDRTKLLLAWALSELVVGRAQVHVDLAGSTGMGPRGLTLLVDTAHWQRVRHEEGRLVLHVLPAHPVSVLEQTGRAAPGLELVPGRPRQAPLPSAPVRPGWTAGEAAVRMVGPAILVVQGVGTRAGRPSPITGW